MEKVNLKIIATILFLTSCDSTALIEKTEINKTKISIKSISATCCGRCGLILEYQESKTTQQQLIVECDIDHSCCQMCGYLTQKAIIDKSGSKNIKRLFFPIFDTLRLSEKYRDYFRTRIKLTAEYEILSQDIPLTYFDSLLIKKAISISKENCKSNEN